MSALPVLSRLCLRNNNLSCKLFTPTCRIHGTAIKLAQSPNSSMLGTIRVRRVRTVKSNKKVIGGLIDQDEVEYRKSRTRNFSDLDQETREAFMNADEGYEPSVGEIGRQYQEYEKEKKYLKKMLQRKKAARKHYSEYKTKELCFLTYAEKETIRRLHEKDPESWTPEIISQSFPISAEGAVRFLRGKGLRLAVEKEIAKHDEDVKERIQQVKSGKIPLDAELRRRLAMRENMPMNIKVGQESKSLSVPLPPKPLGEFARLVASPEKLKEIERQELEYQRAHRKSQEEIEKKEQLFQSEVKTMGIRMGTKLTLDELEKKLKADSPLHGTSSNERLKSSVPEVNYLVNLEAKTIPKSKAATAEDGTVEDEGNSVKRFVEQYNIPKFKPKKSDDNAPKAAVDPHIKYDEKQGFYVYNDATGYERPFMSPVDHVPEKIEIPEGKRVPGAVYKYKGSFYDDEGDFLYRAV